MEFLIRYGQSEVTLHTDAGRLVELQRRATPTAAADPPRLVRDALEAPIGFPALRQALTPDDHVAIVADTTLLNLEELIVPIVEHICAAGVDPGRVTVVVAADSGEMPERIAGVTLERHDPTEIKRLAYVATTAGGRRIYLNRTVVEAEQTVVLAEVRHDPRGGLTGGMAALFPALSDTATIAELRDKRSAETADEAKEVCWLFGLPFFVNVIAGAEGGVHQIVTGPIDSLALARKAIKSLWVAEVENTADLVIACLATASTVAEFAAALTHAASVASPGGVIVLLTDALPDLGSGLAGAREFDSPSAARKQLDAELHEDYREAVQWLRMVHRHRVMVLSRWDEELVEDLFATPLQHAGQVQKLLDAAESCIVIPDANRLYAHVATTE